MPTYDYLCESCQHEFELYQSITAKPIRKCPSCGVRKVVRLIGSGGGLIFRGSGFYETDYRSESYKKAAKADSESASKKSESGGSDSKKESSSSSDTKKSSDSASKKNSKD